MWRIYYEDGTTFENTQGQPHESPPWGVIAVAQPQLERDKIIVGADYLLWRTDRQIWMQCGAPGLDDHLMHFGHLIGCVRKGRWIPTPDYKAIWRRVRKDWGIE